MPMYVASPHGRITARKYASSSEYADAGASENIGQTENE